MLLREEVTGFGDIVPQNADFLPATLMYILIGLIITTMCIGKFFFDVLFIRAPLGMGNLIFTNRLRKKLQIWWEANIFVIFIFMVEVWGVVL